MSLLANLTTNSWQNFKKIIKFFFSLSFTQLWQKTPSETLRVASSRTSPTYTGWSLQTTKSITSSCQLCRWVVYHQKVQSFCGFVLTSVSSMHNTRFTFFPSFECTVFCLFVFVCFCGRLLLKELGIPIGILPMSGAGVNGNAPYQAQELQITTLANPGIQTNFLPLRPVQS